MRSGLLLLAGTSVSALIRPLTPAGTRGSLTLTGSLPPGRLSQDVSPPRILSPLRFPHPRPAHPSKLSVLFAVPESQSCAPDFIFALHFPLPSSFAFPGSPPADRVLPPSAPWGRCLCLLLVTFSNLGQVPGCPLGQSPCLKLTRFELLRRAPLLPYFWILL